MSVTRYPLLVSGSVAANIRYGAKQDLTEHELDQILSDLGLDAYAPGENMAGKHVGFEASAVSGGEKQRIAIAWALARGTPTILLDEPTSALGAASEEQTSRCSKAGPYPGSDHPSALGCRQGGLCHSP
jgi:ATP-binding cassette subfamily B protein